MIKVEDRLPLSDKGLFYDYVKRNFREDHPLLDEEYLRYMFGCEDESLNIVHAVEDGRIAGTLGYKPVKAFWGDMRNVQDAVFFMNWHAEDGHQGLGFLMLRRLMSRFPVCMTFSPTQDNINIVTPLGYKVSEGSERYLYITEDYPQKGAAVSPAVPCVVPEGLSSDIDDFIPDWELYGNMKFSVMKDSGYLKKRYMAHPAFSYKIFICGRRGEQAVVVYRQERAFGEFETGIGKVVDVIYPQTDHGRECAESLLKYCLSLMKADGCTLAEFLTISREAGELAERCGFMHGGSGLPTRFTPVNYMEKRYEFEYYVKGGLEKPPFDTMYFNPADCDDDRPVTKFFR